MVPAQLELQPSGDPEAVPALPAHQPKETGPLFWRLGPEPPVVREEAEQPYVAEGDFRVLRGPVIALVTGRTVFRPPCRRNRIPERLYGSVHGLQAGAPQECFDRPVRQSCPVRPLREPKHGKSAISLLGRALAPPPCSAVRKAAPRHLLEEIHLRLRRSQFPVRVPEIGSTAFLELPGEPVLPLPGNALVLAVAKLVLLFGRHAPPGTRLRLNDRDLGAAALHIPVIATGTHVLRKNGGGTPVGALVSVHAQYDAPEPLRHVLHHHEVRKLRVVPPHEQGLGGHIRPVALLLGIRSVVGTLVQEMVVSPFRNGQFRIVEYLQERPVPLLRPVPLFQHHERVDREKEICAAPVFLHIVRPVDAEHCHQDIQLLVTALIGPPRLPERDAHRIGMERGNAVERAARKGVGLLSAVSVPEQPLKPIQVVLRQEFGIAVAVIVAHARRKTRERSQIPAPSDFKIPVRHKIIDPVTQSSAVARGPEHLLQALRGLGLVSLKAYGLAQGNPGSARRASSLMILRGILILLLRGILILLLRGALILLLREA